MPEIEKGEEEGKEEGMEEERVDEEEEVFTSTIHLSHPKCWMASCEISFY